MDGKLVKKLKRTPVKPLGFIALIAAFLVLWLLFMTNKLQQEGEMDAQKIMIASLLYVVIFGGMIIYYIVKYIKRVRKLKKNGRQSIAYLEENGLLDSADQEYIGLDRTDCSYRSRNSMFRMTSCKNALTENFVFAMSDNIVIPYSMIESVKVKRHRRLHKKGGGHGSTWWDTISVKLTDGRKVKIHTVVNATYTKKEKETVSEIFARIKKGNPECTFDISAIEKYVSLPGEAGSDSAEV